MITRTELIFKANLRRLRENQNLNIKQAAEQMSIDYSYYYRLENPARTVVPRFVMLEKLCAFYKVQPYQLFQEDCPLPES